MLLLLLDSQVEKFAWHFLLSWWLWQWRPLMERDADGHAQCRKYSWDNFFWSCSVANIFLMYPSWCCTFLCVTTMTMIKMMVIMMKMMMMMMKILVTGSRSQSSAVVLQSSPRPSRRNIWQGQLFFCNKNNFFFFWSDELFLHLGQNELIWQGLRSTIHFYFTASSKFWRLVGCLKFR